MDERHDLELESFGAPARRWNWTRGRHQVKSGVEARRKLFDLPIGGTAGGAFTFATTFTGDGSADYILGLPTLLSQTSVQMQSGRGYEWDLFFQDDIKVSSRLTLNAGLRWEPRAPVVEVNGNLVSYVPGQQSQRFVRSPLGRVYPGDPGVPENGYRPDRNNLAPRFGFAWDVFGNGRTSVRSSAP